MGKHESLHDMDPNGMFLDVNVSPRKPKKKPFKIELKSIQILMFLSPLPHVPLTFTKTNVLHYGFKKDVWNKILNIKPCMGHILGT
jgi:hypothetical protein